MLLEKDTSSIRPTGWGYFLCGEVEFLDDSVIIEGK